jgi:hypothetical protein
MNELVAQSSLLQQMLELYHESSRLLIDFYSNLHAKVCV